MQHLLQFSERFGHMLSRIFLTLLYYLVLGPFAVFYRAFADPLNRKHPSKRGGSNWRTWELRNNTVRAARRQD